MIYSSCRLRPLTIVPNQKRKYLIQARYRQSQIDYQIHKQGLSLTDFIHNPFSLEELRNDYPHINFSLPFVAEFCSGTGEFLIDLAHRYRNFLFIGIEVALPCIQRALLKIQGDPNNLLFYHGEGKDFLKHDFSEHHFSLIMVNFPDPWPKKKHIKRRIISSDFVSLCRERLEDGGSLHTATDLENLHHYHHEIIDPILTPITEKSHGKDSNHPMVDVEDFYLSSSRYQEKNLSQSKKVFYTHHLKS